MNLQSLPAAKSATETLGLEFDFEGMLAVGETLLSSVCDAVVWSGEDSTPSTILYGSPTTTDSSARQLVTGGVEGVTYLVTCTAATSESQVLQLSAYLPVCPLSS